MLNNSVSIKFAIKNLLHHYPSIFYPIASLKNRQTTNYQAIERDTELVIEGFQRCANTFSVLAFLEAQNRPVKIAHHYHAPAQIILAAQWGIPALVLIRPPKDAVASFLGIYSQITIGQAFNSYTNFYKNVLPYRENYVLGKFEEVTSDLSKVIYKINQKFGTDFELPNIKVKKEIDKLFEPYGGINSTFHSELERKYRIVEQIEAQKYAKYLSSAESIYNKLAESNAF